MTDAGASSELACPTCGSPMIRRRRRADRNEFWGCSRFPDCRGTRDLTAIQSVRQSGPPDLAPDAVAWDDPRWADAAAGRSARAVFGRRSARHRAMVRRRWPVIVGQGVAVTLVGLVLASSALGPHWQPAGWGLVLVGIMFALTRLFVLPDRIRAWDTGADGEVRTAEVLAPLAAEGFVLLHDLRVPNSRANIDHVVIGPPGVFVVETKNYGGRLRVQSGELIVNGRRRTGVIDQVTRQAGVVSSALDGIHVGRIICIHRAEFPLFTTPRLDGVPITDGRGLMKVLREAPHVLTPEDVPRLALLLSSRLRPALSSSSSTAGSRR